MISRAFVPIAAVIVVVLGCSAAPARPVAAAPWYWLGTVLAGSSTNSPNPSSYTLTVTPDHLAVQADCDRGTAFYELHGDRLVVKPMALNRKGCLGGQVGDYFARQVEAAVRLHESSDVLRLDLASEVGTMFFAKDPSARLLAYRCRDGNKLNAVLIGESLRLWFGDQDYSLTHVPSASGARYSDGSSTTLDTKGVLATLEIGDAVVARDCQTASRAAPWRSAL